MSRVIIPTPASEAVPVSVIAVGDWIGDGGPEWHYVQAVVADALVVGDLGEPGVPVPVLDPDGLVLRLAADAAPRHPRAWSVSDTVQTDSATADTVQHPAARPTKETPHA